MAQSQRNCKKKLFGDVCGGWGGPATDPLNRGRSRRGVAEPRFSNFCLHPLHHRHVMAREFKYILVKIYYCCARCDNNEYFIDHQINIISLSCKVPQISFLATCTYLIWDVDTTYLLNIRKYRKCKIKVVYIAFICQHKQL